MKIVFLNTLNGQVREGIGKFVAEQAGMTDVFCFQEVVDGKGGMKELCGELLPNFQATFAHKVIKEDVFDQATYILRVWWLLDYFQAVSGAKVVGGDFNLDLDTESVLMFERAGYRNLIREYGVKMTRNRLIWEQFPDSPQMYSDFVFVSPEVEVKSFLVPEDEISDHLPLILEVV